MLKQIFKKLRWVGIFLTLLASLAGGVGIGVSAATEANPTNPVECNDKNNCIDKAREYKYTGCADITTTGAKPVGLTYFNCTTREKLAVGQVVGVTKTSEGYTCELADESPPGSGQNVSKISLGKCTDEKKNSLTSVPNCVGYKDENNEPQLSCKVEYFIFGKDEKNVSISGDTATALANWTTGKGRVFKLSDGTVYYLRDWAPFQNEGNDVCEAWTQRLTGWNVGIFFSLGAAFNNGTQGIYQCSKRTDLADFKKALAAKPGVGAAALQIVNPDEVKITNQQQLTNCVEMKYSEVNDANVKAKVSTITDQNLKAIPDKLKKLGTLKDDDVIKICNNGSIVGKVEGDKVKAVDGSGNIQEYSGTTGGVVTENKAGGSGALDGIGQFIIGLASWILLAIVYFLGWIALFLLWVLLSVFLFLLQINPAGVDFIAVAYEPWKIVVSLANLLVLVSFLFVGFGFLLGIEKVKKTGIQNLLLNLAIFTLALNFTLLLCATFVNITQGIGDAMINVLTVTQGENKNQVLVGGIVNSIAKLSVIRCGNLTANPTAECTIFGTGDNPLANFGTAAANGINILKVGQGVGTVAQQLSAAGNTGLSASTATLIMEATFLAVVCYALAGAWKAVQLVLTRILALWMIMVCSPLLLAAMLSPFDELKKEANKYFNYFWQYAIFYPAMVFGLALVAILSKAFATVSWNSIGSYTNTAALPGTVNTYAATGDNAILLGFILLVLIAVVTVGAFFGFVDWFAKNLKGLTDAVTGVAKNVWGMAKIGSYLGGGAIKGTVGLGIGAAKSVPGVARAIGKLEINGTKISDTALGKGVGKVAKFTDDATKPVRKSASDLWNYAGKLKESDNFAKKNVGRFLSAGGNLGKYVASGDFMQYGLQDAEAWFVNNPKSIWKAFTNKQKTDFSVRSKGAQENLEWFLLENQNNPLVGGLARDMLDYSPDFNSYTGKYTPGKEVNPKIRNREGVLADEADKVSGINRDVTKTAALQFFDYLVSEGFKDINQAGSAAKDFFRDTLRKATKDSSFRGALLNDPIARKFISDNFKSVADTNLREQLIKTSAGLLQNGHNVDDETQKLVEDYARSVATASPDSEIRKNFDAQNLPFNSALMNEMLKYDPQFALDALKRAGGTNGFARSLGSTVLANSTKKIVAEKSKDIDPKFRSWGETDRSEFVKALNASSNDRNDDGFTNQAALLLRLKSAENPDPAVQKANEEQVWKDFRVANFGVTNKADIETVPIDDIAMSVEGRRFRSKFGVEKFDALKSLDPNKTNEMLKENARIAFDQHEPVSKSFEATTGESLKINNAAAQVAKSRGATAIGARKIYKKLQDHANAGSAADVANFVEGGSSSIVIGSETLTRGELLRRAQANAYWGKTDEAIVNGSKDLSLGNNTYNFADDITLNDDTLADFSTDLAELVNFRLEDIKSGAATPSPDFDRKYNAMKDAYNGTKLGEEYTDPATGSTLPGFLRKEFDDAFGGAFTQVNLEAIGNQTINQQISDSVYGSPGNVFDENAAKNLVGTQSSKLLAKAIEEQNKAVQKVSQKTAQNAVREIANRR